MKINDEFDSVENPRHYTNTKFEVIDIIEDKLEYLKYEGFLIGNVIKYTLRYEQKNGLEDLKKARWYLNRLIKAREDVEGDEDVVVD